MGQKRTLILGVAVIIGMLAAFSLYSYINGVEDKAYNNAKRVPVYVVATPIAAKTPGEQVRGQKMVVIKEVPLDVVPAESITALDTIQGKQAKTDLLVGQVLVPGMFVDPAEAIGTWAEQLPVGQVAVQVQLDQVRGMVGMLQPSDRVTLLVTMDNATAEGTASDPNVTASAVGQGVRYLYSNVEILAIGMNGAAGAGAAGADAAGQTGSNMITFKVPIDAAQRIISANTNLWVLLEPKNYVPPTKEELKVPISGTNLFDPKDQTPYGPVTTSTTTSSTTSAPAAAGAPAAAAAPQG
jgi:pilus assembly protein CpaB